MFVIYALLGYCLIVMIVAFFVLRGVRTRNRIDDFASFRSEARQSAPPQAVPLHRAAIQGRTVRFFRSPLTGPDFPWAVLRDLFDIATDGATYTISSEWIYANNPTVAQAVLTDQGAEMMLSHRASVELLRVLVSDQAESAAMIGAFREVMAEAYVLQWAGLSREDFLRLCAAAERRPQTEPR